MLAQGAHLVSELLAQAFVAAGESAEMLRRAIGEAIDLLVWIPKAEGGPSVVAQRPLQLPTCLRRLFGAALAEAAGPTVEAGLSRAQAAKRGGSCGPNVRALFSHLERGLWLPRWLRRAAGPGRRPARPGLWDAVLGWAAGPVRDWCRRRAGDSRAEGAAAILSDQAQAFEAIGLAWLALVLRGWQLPDWAVVGFMDVTAGRRVAAVVGRWMGPLRDLLRGMGMGGPASPLLWNMGFDPILVALAEALGIEVPHLCG